MASVEKCVCTPGRLGQFQSSTRLNPEGSVSVLRTKSPRHNPPIQTQSGGADLPHISKLGIVTAYHPAAKRFQWTRYLEFGRACSSCSASPTSYCRIGAPADRRLTGAISFSRNQSRSYSGPTS